MQDPQGGTRRYRDQGLRPPAAALILLLLLAAACGGSDGSGDGPGGAVVISGSSTVEPISIGVAEKFALTAPNVNVTVDGPGTGDGFELFCQGETDVSDASRAISQEEVAACEENGIDFIELKVAIDGIAVLTAPGNDAVGECLSFADLYALVGPESQGFDRWSDANALARELGGSRGAPFPNVPLPVTGPGEESGTYDSFVELVIEDIADERGRDHQTRPDYQASGDDNVIVQGVTGSDTSLGWVGYAFYDANRDQLRAFEVAGEEGGCVAPTPETIAAGEYPVSRPLFIYVNAQRLEENPALEAYIDLYVSEEGLATAAQVGYVALTEDEAEAVREAWDSRTIGSREA